MTTHCAQCAADNDIPHRVPDGLEPVKQGEGYTMLCESCSGIFCDHKGACVDPNCNLHGIGRVKCSTV